MSVTQSANRQTAEQFPFTNAGSAEELYPPVCLRTHWDPTAMLRRVLPEQGKGQSLPLPLDFRPYVKVCQNYVTSAPAEEAPLPPANVVFPMGGEFYPPGRYADAIDNESTLHYLDRRLDKWCQQKEWIPACRSGDDKVNWDRSGRLFNNPTKQDRYGAQKYYALPGGKLPISHGESQPVPPTAQALRAAYAIPRPGGNGVSVDTAYGGIRPIYERPFEYPARIAGISAAANQAPA